MPNLWSGGFNWFSLYRYDLKEAKAVAKKLESLDISTKETKTTDVRDEDKDVTEKQEPEEAETGLKTGSYIKFFICCVMSFY